jgi:hypothetical protein
LAISASNSVRIFADDFHGDLERAPLGLPDFACDIDLQSGCDVVGHGDEPAKITLIFDEKKA